MSKFEFKGDLSFVPEVNPFNNLIELSNVARRFNDDPLNRDVMVYDGDNKTIRSALLFENVTRTLLNSINVGTAISDNQHISLLLPAMHAIVDLDLPIARLPMIDYGGRNISCETKKFVFDINLEAYQDSEYLDTGYSNHCYDKIKEELLDSIEYGFTNDIPYGIGVYSLDLTPTMYNPENFIPFKGILIRQFKYRLNNE